MSLKFQEGSAPVCIIRLTDDQPDLSIVIPVYNEEESLPELIRRTELGCRGLSVKAEVILVDDGSSDHSMEIIHDAVQRFPQLFVGVVLSTNFGQHAAVMAGFQQSRGKFVITMDADLQNPPEEIPRVLDMLLQGYDVVGTIRQRRQDSTFRLWGSHLVNLMVRQLCHGRTMTDYGCMLRGYSRKVVDAVLQCGENGKFIPILAMSYARRTVEITVSHAERMAGKSKYSCLKLISLLFDLLTGTSNFPLRLMTFSGFFIALFGVLFGLVVFVISQIDKSWGADGVFALFAIAFVLMGCQFIGLGLLGEYVGKIHHNTRQRPQFFVEQVIVGQPQAAAEETPEQKLAG